MDLITGTLLVVLLALVFFAYNFVRYRRKLHHELRVSRRPGWWSRDSEFSGIFSELDRQTDMIVDPTRAYTLFQLARSANRSGGIIAEVGVYKGGTAKLIATTAPNCAVYLFDTFEGMPNATDGIDYHGVGSFSDTTLERVQALLADCRNVHIVQGTFPDTGGVVGNERFALVHLDVDNYRSNKDALEFFYPRMECGGVIVFDDYEWEHTPGIRQSIDEFLADKPERVVRTAEYQAVLIKSAAS